MKTMKRTISLILACLMVCLVCLPVSAEGIVCTSLEECIEVVRQALINRLTSVEVTYQPEEPITSEDMYDLPIEFMNHAWEHNGTANQGDYLRWSKISYSIGIGYMQSRDGIEEVDYDYTFTYAASREQEDAVDAEVQRLIALWDLEGASDYEKVKTIYDYLCTTVTYDFENLEDESYLLKYSAYAALLDHTSVCQGYALAFYRLALELGLEARLISGIGNGGGHAWNIVKLGGLWYNLDSTWDAGWTEYGYDYFLKAPQNFGDHSRDAEFDTPEFHAAYPMATSDYVPSSGYTLSGTLSSDTTGTDPVTVELLDAQGNRVVIDGFETEYSFSDLASGSYTLLLRKQNHVQRSYDVTIDNADVTLDGAIYLKGDLNYDGMVDMGDYSTLLGYVKNSASIDTDYKYDCADLNGDSSLNVGDYSTLLAHVKGNNSLWK